MPLKRNRPGNSSSCLELPLQTAAAAAAPVSKAKVMKIDAAAEPSRSRFLTIASPENVGESDRPVSGGFLERCHYCKKRIAHNSEVFMYSNLCAFCSSECRDFQIKLDQSAKKMLENPKKKLAQE
ncbi:hypothetical protein ABFX02_04G032200 [Erythranthe guttata]